MYRNINSTSNNVIFDPKSKSKFIYKRMLNDCYISAKITKGFILLIGPIHKNPTSLLMWTVTG